MALQITEFFGYSPLDPIGLKFANEVFCPFINNKCIKPRHGACSAQTTNVGPTICCPNRLYAEQYKVLVETADSIFGAGCVLVQPSAVHSMIQKGQLTGKEVVAFGRNWGKELPLPRYKKVAELMGSYFVDWILAKINTAGELEQFTAVEVQTIDTTGNYRPQSEAYFKGQPFIDKKKRNPGFSNSNLNWENVNKRILPQLIYKGQVLRREAKCSHGLFFVCPTQIFDRVKNRLGNDLEEYPIGNGTITFRTYGLGPEKPLGQQRELVLGSTFTTTVDQLAHAFIAPKNLPDMGVYESAINKALAGLKR